MKYVKKEFFRDEETFADKTLCYKNVFAVADGMGDKGTGKIAAEIAINTVRESVPIRDERDIMKLFINANNRIINEITKYGDDLFCGTTLSLLVIREHKFLVGHVGDSRIYLMRDGKINMLTVDQVRFKGKYRYVNALGTSWKPEVYINEGNIRENDIFILISDGIVNHFSDRKLLGFLSDNIEKSSERIIEAYKGVNPSDDLSIIIVKI